MAKRPKATRWNRKGGDEIDVASLMACLGAAVHLAGGETTIPAAALAMMDGSIGLRARYEKDGGITLWTYNVVDDIAALHKEGKQ